MKTVMLLQFKKFAPDAPQPAVKATMLAFAAGEAVESDFAPGLKANARRGLAESMAAAAPLHESDYTMI